MKILIAEDDAVCRTDLARTLTQWGHDVIVLDDGAAAWETLQQEDAPKLAILDWMMPNLDGPQVCRKVRDLMRPEPTYLILLTIKQLKSDIVVGLDSGADDFVSKPFDRQELRSRIRVGQRMIALQQKLADRVYKLEDALAQVSMLRGLLPTCCYCKKIRDDKNYWQEVETYVASHSDLRLQPRHLPDVLASCRGAGNDQGRNLPAGSPSPITDQPNTSKSSEVSSRENLQPSNHWPSGNIIVWRTIAVSPRGKSFPEGPASMKKGVPDSNGCLAIKPIP